MWPTTFSRRRLIKAVRFVIDDGRYTDNGKFLSWVLRIAHNQVIDHFRQTQRQNHIRARRPKPATTCSGQPEAGRCVRSRTRMVCEQIARGRARAGRTAARRAARGGDPDALLHRDLSFKEIAERDRREHQHGAGADALCADQPAADDQRKKSDLELTPHNIPEWVALYKCKQVKTKAYGGY